MDNESENRKYENLEDHNDSPLFVKDNNLYISAGEWDRLCLEESTNPIVSTLLDAKKFLANGRSVRLINADGGIALSADRISEFQQILDDANTRRRSLGLALAIPLS